MSGTTTPTNGDTTLNDAFDKAIASLQAVMEKQIEFTTKSNPLKAGASMAQGARS